MKRFILAVVASAALLSVIRVTPAVSATLIVDGSGKLTGATDVSVLGTVYDVVFLDGTCASVFDGCDDHEDFTFGNSQEALFAGQALLDQVFVGSFDDSPALTFGCSDPSRCIVWFPYHTSGFSIDVGVLENWYSELFDWHAHGTYAAPYPDFSPPREDRLVWARFTRAVPEPSTWAMILLGFAGTGLFLRRNRKMIRGSATPS